jgi:endonuclease YncB( thermonuclease family)
LIRDKPYLRKPRYDLTDIEPSSATGFDSTPYWKAEQEAKAAKKGMWAQGDKYVSPREWRKKSGGK